MKKGSHRALTQIATIARKGRSDTPDKGSYLAFEKILEIAEPQDARRGGLEPSKRKRPVSKTPAQRRKASAKPPSKRK